MKRCLQCNRQYSDNTLEFCLEDGSRLQTSDASGAVVTASNPPKTTVADTVAMPLAAVYTAQGVQRRDEVETVVARHDPLVPSIDGKAAEILGYAAIGIALLHNWWQWIYLEKQYMYSITEYFLSANFLMWALLLAAGTTVGLISFRQGGKKTLAYISLVILAINLILFVVPRK